MGFRLTARGDRPLLEKICRLKLFNGRRQQANVPVQPDVSAETFVKIQRKHMFLLILSLITIAGAVAGSHGWLIAGS